MRRIFLFALLLCSCGSDDRAVAPAASTCSAVKANTVMADEAPVGRRFLVHLKPSAGARVSSLALRAEVESAQAVGENLLLVKTSVDSDGSALKAADVDYVEPDRIRRATVVSNDPDIGKQWAHSVVQSAAAWDISRGSSSVIVAVLDTGIDLTHVDLAANIWTNPGETAGNGRDDDGNGYVDDVHGWNFVSDTNNVTADDASHFHGTHVSGTIGAVGNNGIGISGHAPSVTIMPLKFLDDTGAGYDSDAIRAIDYAIAKGAKIISNSWGDFGYSRSLEDAIKRAEAAGILFVAAAGNSANNNTKRPFYPAGYPESNVISVAATTSYDKLASYSDYGSVVHIAAPGSSIYSTKNGNAYQTMSGTSMATPLVSGVLATMVAARPDLSVAQIKGALLSSVDVLPALRDKVMWNGRINAFKALSLVTSLGADWVPPGAPAHVCP